MSQAPVEAATTGGFQPPRNTQFSVFLDNRVGKMLDLIETFSGQALVMAGFSVVDSSDHAVVRVLTSNAELARRLLSRNDLPFSETEVLAVELGGEGDLQRICSCLLAAEINIHFAYPLLVRPRGLPAVVVDVDDTVLAAQVLRKKLFTLFGENDLGDNASRNTPGAPTPN